MNKETLREKVEKIVDSNVHQYFMDNGKNVFIDEIMSLISQHKGEQLEAKIIHTNDSRYYIPPKDMDRFRVSIDIGWVQYKTKQQAVDWCNRFNLKIKGEA